MPTRLSPSYSLTLRIEYPNTVGMLGRVIAAISEQQSNVGAIDIVSTTRTTITRDITIAAAQPEHGQKIVEAVRAVPGVDVVHVSDRTFLLHLGGKIEVTPKVPVRTRDDVSLMYVPGVARVARAIAEDPQDAFNLTIKKNSVAVISDGSQVLGLGNAGPLAALPVLESKAIFFKEFAGVDAFPICLDVQSDEEFMAAVRAIAPTFGAIHLEDIASPRCFRVEEQLDRELDIPVMHNDQHGMAIAVMAALINALRVVGKPAANLRVVVNGISPAAVATVRLLTAYGVRDIVVCDDEGTLTQNRASAWEENDPYIAQIARGTNPRQVQCQLPEALREADVLLGFGRHQALEVEHIKAMNTNAIVFVMAYPEPEIEPYDITDVARVIASGRSDFPNQISNVMVFPGFFRGLLDARVHSVNQTMQMAAAHAIADIVGLDERHEDYVIPSLFDRRVAKAVARAVIDAAHESGLARRGPKPKMQG